MDYTVGATGKYWVRVDLWSSTPTAYNINIKVNGVDKGTYYDSVLTYTSARTVQQFNTQNSCRIKIIYTGPAYTI